MTQSQEADRFPILTKAALEPRDFASSEQRAAFLNWLKANDSWCRGTFRTELDLVDMPLVRVTRYVKDENGHSVVNGQELVTATTEHPIRVPPPDWWQPPNRAQIGV